MKGLLGTETIPDDATLHKEENGVKWYSKQVDRINSINYMEFEGRVLADCWAGPASIFRALASISPEERAQYSTHDELMGAITSTWRKQ